jgi:hypothetical protein
MLPTEPTLNRCTFFAARRVVITLKVFFLVGKWKKIRWRQTIAVQQLTDSFRIKRDSRSEYCACLCSVGVLVEITVLLSVVQLELLLNKGDSDRQFWLIFYCNVCAVFLCI